MPAAARNSAAHTAIPMSIGFDIRAGAAKVGSGTATAEQWGGAVLVCCSVGARTWAAAMVALTSRTGGCGQRSLRSAGQRPGAAVAVVGLFGHAAFDDRIKSRGNAGIRSADARRRCVQVSVDHLLHAVDGEGSCTG